MSYQHVKGKGRPALPMRTDPADVERLERVIVHMKRDPYVMGQVSVAGAARAEDAAFPADSGAGSVRPQPINRRAQPPAMMPRRMA